VGATVHASCMTSPHSYVVGGRVGPVLGLTAVTGAKNDPVGITLACCNKMWAGDRQ
jgi:hypothetical protein